MSRGSLRASRVTKQKKPETIQQVIRRALARELTKMHYPGTGAIAAGWDGATLSTHVAPGTISAVRRFLAKTEGR